MAPSAVDAPANPAAPYVPIGRQNIVLKADPRIAVARIAKGITLYLDDPPSFRRGGLVQALDMFGRRIALARMPWFSTSSVDTWRHLRPEEQATVRAELEAWLLDAPRHLLRIRFADDANVPSCGFSFRFVDEARLARTGVLELAFPLEFPDQELLRLMVRLVRELPIRSGLGGYQAFFNDREKPTAFTAMRGWARRFVGLDIQDTDAMAFGAMTALPGVNWLTYVGPALLAPGEAEALAQRRWLTDATAVGLPRGVFLRAGERPSLGDLNRGEYPRAYLEVADAVRALFVEDPPTFYGSFETLDETRPWFRRFLEPDAWR